MNPKKVILVEISGSYYENLFSQLLFFKNSHFDIHLICTNDFIGKHKNFNLPLKVQSFKFGVSDADDWKNLIEIKRYIIQNRFSKAVFNSINSNLIKNLLTFHFPKETEFVAIVHDENDLNNLLNHRPINKKIKKHFVLNDFLLRDYNPDDSLRVESFYPIFFPEIEGITGIEKSDYLHVNIFGDIDVRFLEQLGLLSDNDLKNKKIRFVLHVCSKTKNKKVQELKSEIEQKQQELKFLINDYTANPEVSYTYFRQGDLILPIINNHSLMIDNKAIHESLEALNVALAFNIPLICDERLMLFDDFKGISFFYQQDNLLNIINNIMSNPEILVEKKKNMTINPKWNFDYQMKKYISFLESNK